MSQSQLQLNPLSKVLVPGYINQYSELNPKEKRQLKYKERYKTENPSWDETQAYLTSYFKKNIPDNSVVLDAGCGNGNYVIDENRSKINWAVGIDADKKATQNNICLDEILFGTLEKLPFDDNRFDAVVSLWVLEHLENPEKVFKEVYRVLKPGGIFMFSTPNRNFLPLVINKLVGSSGLNTLINKKFYGREEKDIFKTFYRANDLESIKNNLGSFKIRELRYNFDPSYTSFNELTYQLTKVLKVILQPHIIGILQKDASINQ